MRVTAAVVVLVGLIAAGAAGAAALDRARTFPTSVTALDLSGQAVATAHVPRHASLPTMIAAIMSLRHDHADHGRPTS